MRFIAIFVLFVYSNIAMCAVQISQKAVEFATKIAIDDFVVSIIGGNC